MRYRSPVQQALRVSPFLLDGPVASFFKGCKGPPSAPASVLHRDNVHEPMPAGPR
jgi:hypothetical protein